MPSPLELAARVLLGPVLVFAAALLVKGYAETGGGFAAGAVAALGWLLQVAALGIDEAERRFPWAARTQRVALIGLAVMAATVLAPLVAGHPPVWHLPRPGAEVTKLGPLELHTAVVFEIGVALATVGFAVAAVHQLARARQGEDR